MGAEGRANRPLQCCGGTKGGHCRLWGTEAEDSWCWPKSLVPGAGRGGEALVSFQTTFGARWPPASSSGWSATRTTAEANPAAGGRPATRAPATRKVCVGPEAAPCLEAVPGGTAGPCVRGGVVPRPAEGGDMEWLSCVAQRHRGVRPTKPKSVFRCSLSWSLFSFTARLSRRYRDLPCTPGPRLLSYHPSPMENLS